MALSESSSKEHDPLRAKTLRLPPPGSVDPVFGCPRHKYLQLERDGVLKLIRLVPKGKHRGTVLVPVEAMEAYIERQTHLEARP